MRFGFINLVLLITLFVKVVPVISECDTYFGCIHDTLFGSFVNFNTTETQVGDIDVPDFDNINLDSDDVDTILKHISSLFEELVADFDLSSPFNVFSKNNKTSISVKSVKTDNSIITSDIIIEDKNKTNILHLKTTNNTENIEGNYDLTTKVQPLHGVRSKNKTKDASRTKIQIPVLDINELSKRVKENEILEIDSIDSYYDLNDNSTDYPIIDYIDLYKDTTNEDISIKTTFSTSQLDETVDIETTTINSNINEKNNNRVYTEDYSNGTDIESNIFPWVTAIFIKNGTSNQFDYYCDGALLSDTIILTAASCLHKPNGSSDDILVILGKRSLRIMTETEIVSKIKEIHIHDNFTGSEHDIAILVMEEVTLSAGSQRARLGGDRGKSATTGWAISGNLTLIQFEKEDIDCNEKNIENTFCAVYGNDVSVCPSYGGLYVTKDIEGWFLRGIRNADPTDKGFCVDRSLVYTDLKYYNEWISMFVK